MSCSSSRRRSATTSARWVRCPERSRARSESSHSSVGNADAAQAAFKGVAEATVKDMDAALAVLREHRRGEAPVGVGVGQLGDDRVRWRESHRSWRLADVVTVALPLLKTILPLAAAYVALRLAAAGVSGVVGRPRERDDVDQGATTGFSVQMDMARQGMQTYRSAIAATGRGMLSAVSATTAWTAALLLVGVAVQKVAGYFADIKERSRRSRRRPSRGRTRCRTGKPPSTRSARHGPTRPRPSGRSTKRPRRWRRRSTTRTARSWPAPVSTRSGAGPRRPRSATSPTRTSGYTVRSRS